MRNKFLIALIMFFCFCAGAYAAKNDIVDIYSDSDIMELKDDAEKGDKKAQYELSLVYGLQNDAENSLKWLHKSAENGYGKAINALGYMYFNGYSVKKNYEKALKWLKISKASKYDDPDIDYMIEECKRKISKAEPAAASNTERKENKNKDGKQVKNIKDTSLQEI
jgi:FOG: TPR repeat, SEL1 subfamily